MKIGLRLFLSSMTFSAVIAIVYGITTQDVVGVFLLSTMSVALLIIAIYIQMVEKKASLPADDPQATMVSGEENIGVFASESYWPFFAALAGVFLFSAIVFFSGAALGIMIASAIGLLLVVRVLVKESSKP